MYAAKKKERKTTLIHLKLCATTNSKWINVKYKTGKFLQENGKENICDFGLNKYFLGMTSNGGSIKGKRIN